MDVEVMLIKTKEAVNGLIDGLYGAAKNGGLQIERDALATEFEAIATYLSRADGNVSNNEIAMLNFMFNLNLGPADIPQLLSLLNDAYKPLMIDLQMPGWLICKALDAANNNKQATELYIATVELMMAMFAASDGDMSASEERFRLDFLARLRANR